MHSIVGPIPTICCGALKYSIKPLIPSILGTLLDLLGSPGKMNRTEQMNIWI